MSTPIRFFLILVSFSPALAACGKAGARTPGVQAPDATALSPASARSTGIPSLPVQQEFTASFVRGVGCQRGIDAFPQWRAKSREEILAWLALYGVADRQANPKQEYLAEFAAEFQKIPESIRQAVFRASGSVHLFEGHGVSEDSNWPANNVNTFDGRNWAGVPGAGGFPYMSAMGYDYPTRFVINRLYEGHGSVNLVLHEFAHSLDAIRGGSNVYSAQSAWQAMVKSDPAFRGSIGSLCNSYCTEHANEAFAESFALYYSCDTDRAWFNQHASQAAQWIASIEGGFPVAVAPIVRPVPALTSPAIPIVTPVRPAEEEQPVYRRRRRWPF